MLQFSEANLVRSICRESFFEFIKEFWGTVIPEPFQYNWHIEYLCNELQVVAHRVEKRLPKKYDLIINIPPGSTKTALTGILFPAWVWTWYPGASFIGASHGYEGAARTSRFNRAVIKSEKYQAVFPHIKLSQDQDAKAYFANTMGGERLSVGVDGDITGRHADFILPDDLINPREARSEVGLQNANRFLLETLWNRKKAGLVAVMVLIQQRLHDDDCTGMLNRKFGDAIKHICIPAELTDDVSPPSLRKYYKDGLMDPIRKSHKFLAEQKLLGEFYYAGQYLQNPIPAGGGMFKTERIVIEQTPPVKLTKTIRYWDLAVTAGGGCYTVGVKMAKNCDGRIWILDVKRGQWGSASRNALIKQVAQMDGREAIIGVEQEGGSGGKEQAQNIIKMLLGFRTRTDHPTGDKVVRADPFAAQVNAGNVSMVAGKWNADYINELSYFPMSKFKDQVDASSGAVKLLTKQEPFVGVIKTR